MVSISKTLILVKFGNKRQENKNNFESSNPVQSSEWIHPSARYTVLQTKNSVRIVSAIGPVTTENTDDSRLQMYCREAMYRTTAN